MVTLENKFIEFRDRLIIKPGQREQVTKRLMSLCDQLQGAWRLGQASKIGSFARGTTLPPIGDADLLLELHAGFAGPSPEAYGLLTALRERLEKETRQTCRIQSHSVGIEYQDFRIDVVPARREGAVYLIPEVDRGTGRGAWIRTSPRAHVDFAGQRDQATGAMALHLVRVLKAWRRDRQLPLRSFHLEMMVLDGTTRQPQGLAAGAAEAFLAVARRLEQGCPDPGLPGTLIDADYLSSTQRTQYAESCRKAARTLDQARSLDAQGRAREAIDLAAGIFGKLFPR